MKRSRKALVAALAAALAQASPEAAAQQAQKVEKIEVTGSNIKRVDMEGPAPVQVITREDIDRTGSNTISDVIRNIPANTAASYDETFTGSFARGSSGVSLRGLGQKSTLTLINGRRMAVYSFAQNLQDSFVDLNSIPLAAVERIEILKDGASAIYGSDAIAGVVNIILRKDYTGAEATISGGVTSRWDGQEARASGAFGIGDLQRDRYNLMVTLDYFNREAIWARDRPNTTDGDYRRFPGGENQPNSTLGNPGTYLRRPGTTPFGSATRQPFATCPADRILVFAGTTNCSENVNVYLTGVPETQRWGTFGRGTFQVTPTLTAFAELGYNSNETFTQVQPFAVPSNQVGPGVARAIQAVLPVGNPSNPFNVPVEVRYRFDDVGPRQVINTTDATRIVAGLNGEWRTWSWESAAGYTRSKSEQKDRNNIRISGLLAAIADGSYNFLDNSRNTPEVYDRIRTNYSRFGDSKMSFVDAKLSGELMQLASGPLGMAAGIEYRKEDYDDVSDAVLATGDVLGRGSTQAIGERNITSAYIEFNVPVLKNLELQLAGRTDRYSDYGRSSTPKVGLRWTVVPPVLLRATYAEGFRAPSISESGDSNAFFFQNLLDTRRCAIDTAYCGTVSLPGQLISNPDLKPETSKSYTVGFVWEPAASTSIAVDYYRIKQKDVVNSQDFQFFLDNEDRFPHNVVRGAPTSDDLARGAPGPVVLVTAPFENLFEVQTSGVDVDARVRWNAGAAGRVTASFTGSYLIDLRQPPAPGEPVQEYAGTYNVPRFKGVAGLATEAGPWAGNVVVNYVHKFKQSDSASATADPFIKSWTTVDVQGSYAGWRNTKLTVGAKNLFDKQPPVAIAEVGTIYVFQQHSLRGLFVYGSVNYRFR